MTKPDIDQPIPIIDLKAQYAEVQEETEKAVLRVLRSGHYVLGPEGKAFEEEIADYIDAKYAVAVNSGTTALHLALASAGVGPGDEVITSPFTFIATAEAISYLGAKPVFVDIDPVTFCIDPARISEKITNRTKAILPIHLYGQAADMDRITEIAAKHKIAVIEDCAQSIGTVYKRQRVGGLGDYGCFSFFPTKNLGAAGEGGLITTNSAENYEKLKALRVHGSKERYVHETIGYNARLNELQCAILRVKLRHLDSWIKRRWQHAESYNRFLMGLDVRTPKLAAYSNHVYHQYTIRLKNRDRVLAGMIERGISCAVHYPRPIHLQPAYQFLGHKEGDFPISEQLSDTVLSLPVYPELHPVQISRVVTTLEEVINS